MPGRWLIKHSVILLCLLICQVTYGNSNNKLIEYLAQEKNNLISVAGEDSVLRAPENDNDLRQMAARNQALIALNQGKIASFENFLSNQKQIQSDLSQKLKILQQIVVTEFNQPHIQQQIEQVNIASDLNKKNIGLIKEDLDLAMAYQQKLLAQSKQLELWVSHRNVHDKLVQLIVQKRQLFASLDQLYAKNIQLQKQINIKTDFSSIYTLGAQLLLNNQVVNLIQHKITELSLQGKIIQADFLLLKTPDLHTLQSVTDTYQNTVNKLDEIDESLKKMIFILHNELEHISATALKKQFTNLIQVVKQKIIAIDLKIKKNQAGLEDYQEQLKKQLAVRQSLSEYQIGAWPTILMQIGQIPAQFYKYMKNLIFKIIDSKQWLQIWAVTLICSLIGLIIVMAIMLNRRLIKMAADREQMRLSGHLYIGVLTLIIKNMPSIAFILSLLVIFNLHSIAPTGYKLLLRLLFVWLTFRSLIFIAKLVLLENTTDISGKDVHLYYRVKWLLLAGGLSTMLMVFSDTLPLSLLLQDIFNRLFMLFLAAASLVAWYNKDTITHLLHPTLKNKKRYVRHAVMLLVISVPITLFITAIIGLVGYMNLAWTMSSYQVQLLFLLALYVVLRGTIFDMLEVLSEFMVASLSNGWLWTEILLKPLDKIVRVILLILSIYSLFWIFEWNSGVIILAKIIQLSDYPIFYGSGTHITGKSLLEFLLLVCVFIWVAKWTREFCYRWLYRDAKDLGIRNSLSVFTQYAVILIGGLITLKTLGIDFGGMAMVLGGLAVGMGFGLRDFANNIVGGLMLLIERPVREGDLITIGSYEGKVAHIGIRSMRVCSWDNMEVLIPNAETFSKPFTNWTHQDSIVRTVVPIKVSRSDDPVVVQQLIIDVLAVIPEVLKEPTAQVILKQIDEALIEFEVRYFVNVELYTRVAIRSEVLFAIMKQFKAAGIKPPIPPLAVELQER